jgi:DNA-binding MarR family transcriptional regulator
MKSCTAINEGDMTTDNLDQTEAAPETADAPKEIRVEDIASVIAVMNRFLSNFAQNPALKSSKLALADWLVLTTLSAKTTENSRTLTKVLGLNPQRLKQILDSLKASGLVNIAGNGPKDAIEVTEQGNATLETIRTAIQPQISDAFKGRERSVVAVERGLKLLLRVATLPVEQ